MTTVYTTSPIQVIRLQKILHATPPPHGMGYGSVVGSGGGVDSGISGGGGCVSGGIAGGGGVQVTVGTNPNSTASTISRIHRHNHKNNKVSRAAAKKTIQNKNILYFRSIVQNRSFVRSFVQKRSLLPKKKWVFIDVLFNS